MQEYWLWLHHIAHHIVPKVNLSPTEIKTWTREDRQRHQIIVTDIWGAHLRQVEHLITNAQAREQLLAITKDLYVETMLAYGEGQPSSWSSPSQAPDTPTSSPEAVPVLEEDKDQLRRGRLILWSSEQGLQELEKVEQAVRQGRL